MRLTNFKKSFYSLVIIAFSLFIYIGLSNVAHAQVCGDPATQGQCGPDGECALGRRCSFADTIWQCIPDTSCAVTCGDPSTTGQCGMLGACSFGQKCTFADGFFQCIPDVTCPGGSSGGTCEYGTPGTWVAECTADCGSADMVIGCTTEGACLCADPDMDDGGSNPGGGDGTLPGLPDYGSVGDLLAIVRNIMTPVGIIIGVILVVSCGYSIMTSQGDPRKLMEAKECITSAIIGLIFVLLAVTILNLLIDSIIK